tara:strand:+ start:2331 stop:2546 length:216 start_codon:yes stop_codon:yes gene_type:complete
MNTTKKIEAFFSRFKSVDEVENVYTPQPKKKGLKIAKTIYPNGGVQMSLNGDSEFYGLQSGLTNIKTQKNG